VFSNYYRPAAALIAAAALAAACAACGSTTESSSPASSSSASSSGSAHIADCVVKGPGPSGVDDAFKDVSGFTVDHICPADVDPTLAAKATEFMAVNSGKVLADGKPLLSVFAGQLKVDAGDAFIRTFLEDMSSRVAPKTVATESKKVGTHSVTHFSVPSDANGYAYFEGPTVVIAYDLAGGPDAAKAENALSEILANTFPSP
jgi:hypothetical protein